MREWLREEDRVHSDAHAGSTEQLRQRLVALVARGAEEEAEREELDEARAAHAASGAQKT